MYRPWAEQGLSAPRFVKMKHAPKRSRFRTVAFGELVAQYAGHPPGAMPGRRVDEVGREQLLAVRPRHISDQQLLNVV